MKVKVGNLSSVFCSFGGRCLGVLGRVSVGVWMWGCGCGGVDVGVLYVFFRDLVYGVVCGYEYGVEMVVVCVCL